jgi:hypothetical protein
MGLPVTRADPAKAHIVFPVEGVASFVGPLSAEEVERFIAAAAGRQVKHLMITSQGGPILAGVRLGEWVRDNGVSVVVDRLCMSSCANYVFPAGKEKIIRPKSLVVWHGSATQRNFREKRQRLQATIETLRNGGTLSPDDQSFHEQNVQFLKLWDEQTNAQEALLNSLRVDEYITRLGQEPVSFRAAWTVSVATMKLFGITDVLAEDAYGTSGYVAAAARALDLKMAPLALEATRSAEGILVRPAP